MSLRLAALVAATTASVTAPLHAALVAGATGVTQTITFDASVGWNDGIADNDVLRSVRVNNHQAITDSAAWEYNAFNAGGYGLASDAWRYGPGESATAADVYGDVNGDGNLEQKREVFSLNGIDGATLPALGAANNALAWAANRFAEFNLTLRVKNDTGGVVQTWDLGLDTWFNDAGRGVTDFALQYSTDDVNFTTLDNATSGNTGAGWSPLDALGGTAAATVADGGYLYVRTSYTRPGGSGGNAVAFDNLSVTANAVPEPGAVGVLAIGAAALLRRRRRHPRV